MPQNESSTNIKNKHSYLEDNLADLSCSFSKIIIMMVTTAVLFPMAEALQPWIFDIYCIRLNPGRDSLQIT